MNIAAIRAVIDYAIFVARDLKGYTADEFYRVDAPRFLLPQLEALESLTIPEHFPYDRERREWALEFVQQILTRWRSEHGITPAELPTFPTIQ